ncbi:hypothetical protein CGZ98_15820 [Enemella evansiae]|uniref:hypothetical protein n=1 Tax=Enemella evansiae TaxID=2016499 RepID=UPI000B976659|nr:hypothetical protein [Enemella evansiae]OYO08032.1 hypothetical protein CGZ98_15820 [Enemella evansiae]
MTTNKRAEVFAAIRAESDTIAQAEARRLVAIAAACDTYSGLNTHTDELTARVLHGEQLVFPGADGTPGITEFFHLEFGDVAGVLTGNRAGLDRRRIESSPSASDPVAGHPRL